MSKVEGEEHCSNAILIRSSIIGPDSRSQAGLYSWFRSAVQVGAVRGFKNHLWNGVTTTAFARLAIGLMRSDFGPMRQHWTPLDTVSKYQLLQFFADAMDLPESSVKEFTAPQSLDRTLLSVAPGINEQLWGLAGYDGVPTIHDLVAEMVGQE
jgi:dTDP-4-dehydrorhamnose reductase